MESVCKKIGKALLKWYQGEFIPWENDPNSNVVFIGHDHKLHWTAKIARYLVGFYLKHWKWLWSSAIAILLGLLTSYLKYCYEPQNSNSSNSLDKNKTKEVIHKTKI